MDFSIALMLAQDGLTNGAIYALLALALVLVFSVTRVIFIPQGEFIAYGALTLASLQAGKTPGTVWLLLAGGVLVTAVNALLACRQGRWRRLPKILLLDLALPAVIAAIAIWSKPQDWPLTGQIVMTLLLVVPLGPMVYRLAFQPLAEASVLVLLIVSVAVHLTLGGLGLLFFGAEGSRTTPFSEAVLNVGPLSLSGQSLWILGASGALIALLYFFFEHALYGKALRATALNRVGARLMGIPTTLAGKLCFFMAALIGAFSGVLISSVTTLYYDSGFLIGLKGFVGAIIGGLASYPVAAVGAVFVGLLESYASFWWSPYKEVIVFTLIIPVLLWRSMGKHHVVEED